MTASVILLFLLISSSSPSLLSLVFSYPDFGSSILTSKEIQWRHNVTEWNNDRYVWLQQYRQFWIDILSPQIPLAIQVGDEWNKAKFQKYTFYDSKDGLFERHSANLVRRVKLEAIPSATLTVKFNFRDWALARDIKIRTIDAGSDDDSKAKVEQDIYPCYDKFGRSSKVSLKSHEWEPSSFSDLQQYYKNPSDWFDYTVSHHAEYLDLESKPLFPRSKDSYRYIVSIPLKLGNIKTELTAYASYNSYEDATSGKFANIVESSVRVEVDDAKDEDADLIRNLYRILRGGQAYSPVLCDCSPIQNL